MRKPDFPRGHSPVEPTDAESPVTVQGLLEKAVQNQQILQRYQHFELQLLDCSGFGGLLDLLLKTAPGHFQLDFTELWLYDPEHTLEELLDPGVDYGPLQLLRETTPLKALYGDYPAIRLLATTSTPLPVFRGLPVRSAALLPLLRQGLLVGSLHFGALGHQRFGQDKSTDFIAHLAHIVAVCFENAVNHERLHRLSMYDVLTQVKNRRAFHQALEQEISRAGRTGDPLSLLFVDLDYFKQINDQHGHLVGDRVLKEVAQFMQAFLRKTDHVCRYGGEEFALVLPNCGQQRAMEVAERMRQQVAELCIRNEKGEALPVTLSVGVSCWLPMEESPDEELLARQLVNCADQGVYRAKHAGRNRTSYFPLDG